jgi:hypothetical protein
LTTRRQHGVIGDADKKGSEGLRRGNMGLELFGENGIIIIQSVFCKEQKDLQ